MDFVKRPVEKLPDDTNRQTFWQRLQPIAIITVTTVFAYFNVINAPLLYDDTAAVLNNPDVQQMTKLSDIWSNDFWGYSMTSDTSHKSYRPFTVLMFRYLHHNYGNWSPAYHVTNIILHAIVSILFYFVCRNLVFSRSDSTSPLAAGLMFVFHPIHTEAVCGAVGCAELLSAVCFMLSILIYSYPEGFQVQNQFAEVANEDSDVVTNGHTKNEKKMNGNLRNRKPTKNSAKTKDQSKHKVLGKPADAPHHPYSYPATIIALIFATIAMLCKESGVTVLGVLLMYELCRRQSRKYPSKRTIFSLFDKTFLKRSLILFTWGLVLLFFRLWIMGWKKPTYTRTENPASYAEERLTRVLTYFYLAGRNFYLLVFPINLCYDYSNGTIPLITTLFEIRNLISLLFLILCIGGAVFFYFCLRKEKKWSKGYVLGCSIMVFSFLPASNLLFPVGFVIAERVLYLPSVGFIIIVAVLWSELMEKLWSLRQIFQIAMGTLLCFYFYQTVSRSIVWTSKELLFKSGLEVYQNNAKMHYNWGNYLQKQYKKYEKAAVQYERVLELDPNFFSALNNLGSMYEILGRPATLVEKMYQKAMEAEPQNEIGYANLARIFVAQKRNRETTEVLRSALMNIKHKAPLEKLTEVARNLINQYPQQEARGVLYHLLQRGCLQNDHPARAHQCSQLYLPELQVLSERLSKRGDKKKLAALRIQMADIRTVKPKTMKALSEALNSSESVEEVFEMMLNMQKKPAAKTQQSIKDIPPSSTKDVEKLWNSAMDLFRKERYEESKPYYEAVIEANPTNYEAVGQYAAVLFQLGHFEQGEQLLSDITKKDPDCQHVGAWHNLATLYGRLGKYAEAMALVSKCLMQREKSLGTKDDKRSTLLCQLGKHTLHRSIQLKQSGNVREADPLKQEALKILNKALQIDPNNQEAKDFILQMKLT